MKKVIPNFENEDQEREFWGQNDSDDYLDWDKAEKVSLPKLKPTTPPAPDKDGTS